MNAIATDVCGRIVGVLERLCRQRNVELRRTKPGPHLDLVRIRSALKANFAFGMDSPLPYAQGAWRAARQVRRPQKSALLVHGTR